MKNVTYDSISSGRLKGAECVLECEMWVSKLSLLRDSNNGDRRDHENAQFRDEY